MQYSFRNAKFSIGITPSIMNFPNNSQNTQLHLLFMHLNNKSEFHTLEYGGFNYDEHFKNTQEILKPQN